jgi:hypothetical protein
VTFSPPDCQSAITPEGDTATKIISEFDSCGFWQLRVILLRLDHFSTRREMGSTLPNYLAAMQHFLWLNLAQPDFADGG